MRKSILMILALVMVTSSCFAFGICSTGTVVGQDQFVIQGIYSSTALNIRSSTGSIAGLGAKIIYGATPDMDLNAKYWTGSVVLSDAEISQASSTIGVGLKYAFLKVAAKDPIDLAGFIDIDSTTSKDLTWSINTVGVTGSKLIREKLSLYGTLAILMNTAKWTGGKTVSESATQMGVGVKYEVNKRFNVLGELTRFMFDGDIYQTIAIAGEFSLEK